MTKVHEGAYHYAFPSGWIVVRLQEDDFYRRHFQGFNGGSKEVDFAALDAKAACLWLMEAKDYSLHPRSKPGDVIEEVASKVRDSLACIEAMKISAGSNAYSRSVAEALSKAQSCRVAFHLELPATENLALSRIDVADMKIKLRSLMRAVDKVALVGDFMQITKNSPIAISRA